MKTVIKSETGKKQAIITYSMHNKFNVVVEQLFNNGIEIETAYIIGKCQINTFNAAEKFAKKYL